MHQRTWNQHSAASNTPNSLTLSLVSCCSLELRAAGVLFHPPSPFSTFLGSTPFSHAAEGKQAMGPLMYQRVMLPCACAHCCCVFCVCALPRANACSLLLQRLCPACGTHKPLAKFSGHKTCWSCRSTPPSPVPPSPPSLSPLEQVGTNAISLVRSLPVHSHHRGALLSSLSSHLSSTTAAHLLGSSASHIRNCRNKRRGNDDLFLEKYPHDVKRKKLSDETVSHMFQFLTAACPTKSGERSLTFHQLVNDDSLYQAYVACTPAGIKTVCLNTFLSLKRWLRVRRSGAYFGQFDCYLCLRMKQLPLLMAKATEEAERMKLGQELQKCQHHHQLTFPSAINIS